MKNSLNFNCLLIALALLICCAAGNSVAAQTASVAANRQLDFWQTFAPAGGRFKIAAPRELSSLEIPAELEERLNLKVYQASLHTEAFRVSYVDYPVDDEIIEILKQRWEELWNGFREGFRTNAPASAFLVSDKNITKGDVSGREIVIEGNAVSYKVQFFLVGKRFYAVEMQTPVLRNAPDGLKKIYQAEADKFFNSFQILDNKTTVAKKVANKGKTR
jgi:hypothetical protein